MKVHFHVNELTSLGDSIKDSINERPLIQTSIFRLEMLACISYFDDEKWI